MSADSAAAAPGLRLPGPRLLVPGLVAAIQVAGAYAASFGQPERRALDAFAVFLLAGGGLLLAWRQERPVVVLWATLAATTVYHVAGYPEGPVFFALIVAFVGAVIDGYRLAAVLTLVTGYPAIVWLPPAAGVEPYPGPWEALGVAAWLLVLLTASEAARVRRERALQHARAAAEETRRRASEERMRIARELHDVLAHNISLINVQAGVALHLMDGDPGQGRRALEAIKQASAEALGEVRLVLEVLRSGPSAEPRAPTPRLRDLGDMVARTETAGIAVELRIEGVERPVCAPVDLAAYRTIQEALTNVVRHSGASRVRVTVAYGDRELSVRVEDDGRGAAGQDLVEGSGIQGMRQRAGALGGRFEVAPRAGGGLRVEARFPLNREETGG